MNCSIYDIPGLAPRMNVLFWRRHNFQISFSNSDTSRNAWNHHCRSFLVDTGILSNNTKFLSHECLMAFCSLTKYNDNPPPIRLYTKSVTFLPNSTFYWFMRGFHRTFATGVACWQETLIPLDTIWTCICSTCLDQSFSRFCIFSGLFSLNIPRYFLHFAFNRLLMSQIVCVFDLH